MTFQDQFFARKTTPVSAKPVLKAKPASVAAPLAPATQTGPAVPAYRNRSTLAYAALLTFSFLYYARPEDFVPGLALIPVAKISGGLALLGLLLSWGRRRAKMPIEIKLVLILFFDMCLTVPFAFWRGGAYQVIRDDFSKAVISALLISMIVSSLSELRKLLWVQAAAITIMTMASIIIHPGPGGMRMWGLGGVFSNPNDFAINIAINFPLCVAFLLGSKGVLKKLIWTGAILVMVYGVIATYSRSGFIAMVICLLICVWEFGIRGKRPQVLIAAVVMIMLGVGLALTTPKYILRLKTLVGGDITGTGDHGSMDARRDLLMESIHVTMQHPILGVGPGNFQAYTKSWHVTHNTYTELSSEAGIPALLLFLTILMLAFRNTARLRKTAVLKAVPQIALFNSALRAGLTAYMVGAAFASTTYSLFPYFMVAYTTALYRIGSSWEPTDDKPVPQGSVDSRKREKLYGKQQQGVLAGIR
jgi:O-antigen ligase